MHEALYYRTEPSGAVSCQLCPRFCRIEEGQTGFCRVRKNCGGKLYSLNYGLTSGIALDPVEKKPLYHFHPGEFIVSLGTKGCNLGCRFCQNWQLSQAEDVRLEPVTAAEIVAQAKRLKSFGVAYTYTEPLVWYEFVLESSRLNRATGLKNVLVTNGYVNPGPLSGLLGQIDALNIDLKAMDEEFYRAICQGTLTPVLETIRLAKKSCHVEITNLVIPGLNDTPEHFQRLADWIAGETGTDTPLHLSRYFPRYRLNLPPTPLQTLEQAARIAEKKLNHVYLGNV